LVSAYCWAQLLKDSLADLSVLEVGYVGGTHFDIPFPYLVHDGHDLLESYYCGQQKGHMGHKLGYPFCLVASIAHDCSQENGYEHAIYHHFRHETGYSFPVLASELELEEVQT
jgi:hypothetical protein